MQNTSQFQAMVHIRCIEEMGEKKWNLDQFSHRPNWKPAPILLTVCLDNHFRTSFFVEGGNSIENQIICVFSAARYKSRNINSVNNNKTWMPRKFQRSAILFTFAEPRFSKSNEIPMKSKYSKCFGIKILCLWWKYVFESGRIEIRVGLNLSSYSKPRVIF